MAAPAFDVAQAHRYFAVECNNRAWDWLESDDRTVDGGARAMSTAQASYFHWSQVGQPVNILRAACLLANVYAAAGQGDNAARASEEALKLCDTCGDAVLDWDRAFVRDALARAALLRGDQSRAAALRTEAATCGAAIADAQSREMFQNWFARWDGATA